MLSTCAFVLSIEGKREEQRHPSIISFFSLFYCERKKNSLMQLTKYIDHYYTHANMKRIYCVCVCERGSKLL
jgi:hypothetical protein